MRNDSSIKNRNRKVRLSSSTKVSSQSSSSSSSRSSRAAVRHGSVVLFLLLLTATLLLLPTSVHATITAIDTGKEWSSKPDHKVGRKLRRGIEYIARVQYVSGNLLLCPGPDPTRIWNITRPPDGNPGTSRPKKETKSRVAKCVFREDKTMVVVVVQESLISHAPAVFVLVPLLVALVVRKGECTTEEKALVASTRLYPPGLVHFIIVDGDETIVSEVSGKGYLDEKQQQQQVGIAREMDRFMLPDGRFQYLDPVMVAESSSDVNVMHTTEGQIVGVEHGATDEDWPALNASMVATEIAAREGDSSVGATDEDWPSKLSKKDSTEDDDDSQDGPPRGGGSGIEKSTPTLSYETAVTDEDWPPLSLQEVGHNSETVLSSSSFYKEEDDLSATDEDWPRTTATLAAPSTSTTTDDAAAIIGTDHILPDDTQLDDTLFDAEENDDESFLGPNDEGVEDGDFNNYNITGRRLRKKSHKSQYNERRIKVAVLHASYTIGYELLDLILHETSVTKQSGGTRLLLNTKEPPRSGKVIFLWILFSASFSASACCCLLLCINRTVFEEERPTPPRRPAPRRLTNIQVRANHPSFICQECDPTIPPGTECSICLDDLEAGNSLRRLPCQHVFHSTCIARWLVERSATCPLCKVDLYEEEEEEESSNAERGGTNATGGVEDRMLPALRGAQATLTADLQQRWGWGSGGARGREVGPAPTTTVAAAATTTPISPTGNAPLVLSRRTGWWPFSSSSAPLLTTSASDPLPSNDIAARDSENTVNESAGPSGGFWNWFGGRNQLRTHEEGRLTELTEPLLSSAAATGPSEEQQHQPTGERPPNATLPAPAATTSLPPPAAFQSPTPGSSDDLPVTSAEV
jgi:hypothetical protein